MIGVMWDIYTINSIYIYDALNCKKWKVRCISQFHIATVKCRKFFKNAGAGQMLNSKIIYK